LIFVAESEEPDYFFQTGAKRTKNDSKIFSLRGRLLAAILQARLAPFGLTRPAAIEVWYFSVKTQNLRYVIKSTIDGCEMAFPSTRPWLEPALCLLNRCGSRKYELELRVQATNAIVGGMLRFNYARTPIGEVAVNRG